MVLRIGGDGFRALDALMAYKQRHKLMLQPTRELHSGMNHFQRLYGYQQATYAAFVEGFFPKPHTGDMQTMLDDIEPYRAQLRGERHGL